MPENKRAPAMPGFLAHGGEMGALISTQDWRESALGAPEAWPDRLKAVLATILGSPKPMYILWGPELLLLFNNAYAPMLGSRLGGAIGRPFAQVWTELWADFEPILKKALLGEGSFYENKPLTLMRHGYPEPTWWTFSYLPLRDAAGAVVGVQCIATETTREVRAQERLADKQKQQAFRVELGDALRGASQAQALMAVAAEKLGQYLGASCVGYGEIDEAGQCCRVRQDWTAEGFPSVVGTHRLDYFGPLMAQQLRAGRTVAVHDSDQDPLTTGDAYEESYQATGNKAFINAPLIRQERLAAILFVLNAAPRVWTDSEQALVEEVAERTWVALQRLQAELDLRHSTQALDQRTTELLHAENALRQSQKLEALGQLTGGVAHDFNNLLAVISGSVELLRRGRLPVHSHGQYLDRISDTVSRATKLTAQLLAFARQQPLKPEVFDVDVHVKNVIDLVRPLMGSQVEMVHQPCQANACMAEADINQFETALINLAVNARDAMDAQGRITVQVQAVDRVPASPARTARAGAFIAISVSDTGCGIAADQLKAIFAPFYTTKAVGKGTGLGLSQVFSFAEQSGGEIQVRSELGAGSVFTLYLAPASSVPLPLAPAAGLDGRAQGPASQGSVLVVEDNVILGEMTCEILNAQGYRAVWAASAAAALELLARQPGNFGLVFSDVVMPGMNGIELGMEVRRRYPSLPVVLTSGYNAVVAQEGEHRFDLLLKPYTLDTLVQVFRKALAGKSGKA
jgi:signal transduction histidine kinase/ActR/RegA family two-component response regulator